MVLEGDEPNLAVTAPGATLALALMFLKTNDAAAAAAFAVPSTAYALDLMRPDQVNTVYPHRDPMWLNTAQHLHLTLYDVSYFLCTDFKAPQVWLVAHCMWL